MKNFRAELDQLKRTSNEISRAIAASETSKKKLNRVCAQLDAKIKKKGKKKEHEKRKENPLEYELGNHGKKKRGTEPRISVEIAQSKRAGFCERENGRESSFREEVEEKQFKSH